MKDDGSLENTKKHLIGNKGKQHFSDTRGISAALGGLTLDTRPLEILIGEDSAKQIQNPQKLGVVELHETAEFEEPLELNGDVVGGFNIIYRSTHKSDELLEQMKPKQGELPGELPADVAAVIARAFLLANISFYRIHARNILKDYVKTTDTESQEMPSNRLGNILAKMAAGLAEFISNPRDASAGNDAFPHKVPLALFGGSVLWIIYLVVAMRTPGSSPWLESPQWVTPFFVVLVAVLLLALSGYSLSTLKSRLGPRTDQEDGTNQSIQKDIKNGAFALALASATTLPGALLVWLAWPMLKYGQHGQAPNDFDDVILLLFFCAACIILLAAGNFKTHEQKKAFKRYETTKNDLDDILSGLAQTNANVAALNFKHEIVGIVDETRLREFDDKFRPKEAVVSLESVIRARQRYLHENVAELLERQQRARRTVLAAGSGMFAGYFTYEVGGSVMKYVDLPVGFDEHSFDFWMKMSPQVQFVMKTTGDTAPKPCKLEKLPYPRSDNELKVPQEKCTATTQEIAAFRAKYHEDELNDAGWLLIITLIVSLLTAWVAVRKPEKEQSPN